MTYAPLGWFLINITIVHVNYIFLHILLTLPMIGRLFSAIALNIDCVMNALRDFSENAFRNLVYGHTDINECARHNGGCSYQATCHNTVGSFTCTCNQGYTGDGRYCKGTSFYACVQLLKVNR